MLRQEVLNMLATMIVNTVYAGVCISIGLLFMVLGYKLFDSMTPFNTGEMLSKDPLAVAIFNGAIVLGVSICSGIIIGLACN